MTGRHLGSCQQLVLLLGWLRKVVKRKVWFVSLRLFLCLRLRVMRLDELEAVGWRKELEVNGREYGLPEKNSTFWVLTRIWVA